MIIYLNRPLDLQKLMSARSAKLTGSSSCWWLQRLRRRGRTWKRIEDRPQGRSLERGGWPGTGWHSGRRWRPWSGKVVMVEWVYHCQWPWVSCRTVRGLWSDGFWSRGEWWWKLSECESLIKRIFLFFFFQFYWHAFTLVSVITNVLCETMINNN